MKRTPEHKAVTWREGRRIEDLVRTFQRRGGAAAAVDGKYVCRTLSLNFSSNPFYQDFKQCLPSLIILIGGLTLMALIIPYAFASVIKQLQEEEALRNMRHNDTMGGMEETQTNVAL